MDPESLEPEQTLRHSARANKGKKSPRYGASETTSVVGSTASSTSSALRRKRLEAELALQRRQAELTAQIVEQQRALATAEHDLWHAQAEIDEEEEETFLQSVDGVSSREDKESRSSRIAQWVNDVSPSQNRPQPISVSQQPAAETATMATSGRLRHVQLTWTSDFGFWHFHSS